jgi:hypothetical protein
MSRKGTLITAAVLGAAIISLFVGQRELSASLEQQAVQAPVFEVDPFWPKPLPNGWLLGMVIGVGVDAKDHVFIVHRGQATLNARTEGGYPPTGPCCSAAPPVSRSIPRGTS